MSSQIIYILASGAELREALRDIFKHLCYELPPSSSEIDRERAAPCPHPPTQTSGRCVVQWGWHQYLFFFGELFYINCVPLYISGIHEVTVVTIDEIVSDKDTTPDLALAKEQ